MGEGFPAGGAGQWPLEEERVDQPLIEVAQDGQNPAYAMISAEQARMLGNLDDASLENPDLITDEGTRNLLTDLRQRGDSYALVMPGRSSDGAKELPARFMRLDAEDYGTTVDANNEAKFGLPSAAGMYNAWERARSAREEERRPTAVPLPTGKWWDMVQESKRSPAVAGQESQPVPGWKPPIPGGWAAAVEQSKQWPAAAAEPQSPLRTGGYKLPGSEPSAEPSALHPESAAENAAATEEVTQNERIFSQEVQRADESLQTIEAQLQTIAESDMVDHDTLVRYRDELNGLVAQLGDAANRGPWQANYLHGYEELRTHVSNFMDRARVAITEVEQRQQNTDQAVRNHHPFEGRSSAVTDINDYNIGRIVGNAEALLEPLQVARSSHMLRFYFDGAERTVTDRYATVNDALSDLQQLQVQLTAASEDSGVHHAIVEQVQQDIASWRAELSGLEYEPV